MNFPELTEDEVKRWMLAGAAEFISRLRISSLAEAFELPDGTIIRTRLGYAAILGTHPVHGRGAYMTNLEGLRGLSDNDFPAHLLWTPTGEAA